MNFDHFIAVDWSGAKGSRHKSIAIAYAQPGSMAPKLVTPPHKGGWARQEVGVWLKKLDGRVLAGFDFSFAPPWLDKQAYLPGVATPDNGPEFWAWLDVRVQDEDGGAASFLEEDQRRFFYFGKADGKKADYMRLRQCEQAFNAAGGAKPSSIFDVIGAAQVAKASFAGMRLLHHMQGDYTIWPFEPLSSRTIVEIYTRAFLQLSHGSGRKIRDKDALTRALAAFSSEAPKETRFTDHETDALVAAAGLRVLATEPSCWTPNGLTPAIARTEGWTFTVGMASCAMNAFPAKAP